jgi:hypothetical protein
MRLYLFLRDDGDVGHNEAAGFVVAADSQNQARFLIRNAEPRAFGEEGREAWNVIPVLELGQAKPGLKRGIILRDWKG